jgi:putative inorganic carbon (HCO3(-)) transporter
MNAGHRPEQPSSYSHLDSKLSQGFDTNSEISAPGSRRGELLLSLAFVFTMAYIVLSYLSPGTLFPRLAQLGIMSWIAAAAALTCLYRLLSHLSLWRSPYPYLMFGLMASVAISRASAAGALAASREFLSSSLVFFLVMAVLDKISKLRVLSLIIALAGIFLLTQCFYNWNGQDIHGPHVWWQKVYNGQGQVIKSFPRLESVGFLADANDFAQFLLVAASLLMLVWRARRPVWNALLVVLPMLYILYGVHATYSRGGMLGLTVLVFFLSNLKFNKFVSLLLAGGVLATSLLTYPRGPKAVVPQEFSAVGRVRAWQGGVTMFQSSPVFGVGFQTFTKHYGRAAHNSFVQCLAELGIFGCFFWLSLIVFSLLDLTRILGGSGANPATSEIALAAYAVRTALLTFLVTSWFLSRSYTLTLYVVLGIAAAIQLAFSGETRLAGAVYLKRWGLTVALALVCLVAVWTTNKIWNLL